jgi:hypothetical protein
VFIEMEGVFLTLAGEVIFGSKKRGIALNGYALASVFNVFSAETKV